MFSFTTFSDLESWVCKTVYADLIGKYKINPGAISAAKLVKMFLLRSDVLHALLVRRDVPIEVRTVIINNYLPFLTEEFARHNLTVSDLLEMKKMHSESRNWLFNKHWIQNLSASTPNCHFRLQINLFDWLGGLSDQMTILIYHYNLDAKAIDLLHSKKNTQIPDSMKPSHPDIQFIHLAPYNAYSFQFHPSKITEENAADLHRAIMLWYTKVIRCAWNTNDIVTFLGCSLK